jgi:hypothetical protein
MLETIKYMWSEFDTLQRCAFVFQMGCVGLFSYCYTRAVIEIIKLEFFKGKLPENT